MAEVITSGIRKIDHIRRLVIPKNICNNLNIKTGDFFKIHVDCEGRIIVEHTDNVPCTICGSIDYKNVHLIKEKYVCNECCDLMRKATRNDAEDDN